ncbi:hypothetical protein ACQZV8_08790 [Magnetococcales bacterium HHB-1]
MKSLHKDLKNPRWIIIKGFLFLISGVLGVLILWLDHPSWKFLLLLGVVIFSFMRFYYFMFYVISHYIDPNYRFSGLGSFLRYWWQKNRHKD